MILTMLGHNDNALSVTDSSLIHLVVQNLLNKIELWNKSQTLFVATFFN